MIDRPSRSYRRGRTLRPCTPQVGAIRALIVVAWLTAACGGGAGGSPSADPASATAGAGTDPPATTPLDSPQPSGSPIPQTGPPVASPAAGALVVDDGLLAILPASVDGVALQPASAVAASLVSDPQLAASASGLAVAIVGGAGAPGGSGAPAVDDFASASVIRLRPGTFDKAFFDRWRHEYDDAACAPAGGVAMRSQVVLGARAVERSECAELGTTYHVHLAGDILVSVTAVGDRRFGDLVMAALRE